MTVPLRLAANQSNDAQVTSEQREHRENAERCPKKIILASLRAVESRSIRGKAGEAEKHVRKHIC